MTAFFDKAFRESCRRCVYCCRDLAVDLESFMLAEEDHLVPRRRGGADVQENIVIACAVCNRLKGDFDPTSSVEVVIERRQDKAELIVSARHHIMKRRAEWMKTFSDWVCLPS